MGILVERCGVWVVVLMACWSQKYQSLGKTWSKLLQMTSIGQIGHKCSLRRFEASPRLLIPTISITLLICIDLSLRIRYILLVRWRKLGWFPPRLPRFFVVYFGLAVVPPGPKWEKERPFKRPNRIEEPGAKKIATCAPAQQPSFENSTKKGGRRQNMPTLNLP